MEKDRTRPDGAGITPPIISDELGAVIFDLDGSLMDSMWVWGAIDREYLGRFGHDVPLALQQEIGGMSFLEIAVMFRERFGIPDSVGEIMEDWNRMARDKYAFEVRMKPGADRLIAWCREHGIPMGIATSNSRELVGLVLASNGISDVFGAVVTGNDDYKGKPAPDVYLACARMLGVRPEKCLVFEDIVPGIQAALAAGMQVCSVWDEHAVGQQEDKLALAHCSIQDYTDLVYREE